MTTIRALSQEDGNLNSIPIISSRNKPYLDIDLLFTAKPTTGDIYKKTDAAAVRQAVKTLLLTNAFEKPFLPRFGADLRKLLFDLNDPIVAPTVRRQILENIAVYEPRCIPQEVRINNIIDSNEIEVSVTFQIKSTLEQVTLTTTVSRLR